MSRSELAWRRRVHCLMASATAEIHVEPGFVRMTLADAAESAQNITACREFVRVCVTEGATRAMIANRADGDAARLRLREALGVLTGAMPRPLKLAIVARGTAQAASEKVLDRHRSLNARVFPSEHEAAAWLLS